MLHLVLHAAVPALVAFIGYRRRWRLVALLLIATMVVDLDHLLASPVYDPDRCSIGFHPLHGAPAMVVYALLFAIPFRRGRETAVFADARSIWISHLIGLGLLIHMMLDGIDCLV